ncbi:Aste57867_18193 [Aphanomyces stellatus]|uniref:Aste57867_18193 protein n=1 Tax=Aphanomyces stellatus TaxID=120398 RepID=A0A485LAU4_9STRA|nr:hypothetical protein As57867_018131 [Aphanomyces stellatus]VFT94931.1 Aste57867_18193 [Aphanomyces stellatus]
MPEPVVPERVPRLRVRLFVWTQYANMAEAAPRPCPALPSTISHGSVQVYGGTTATYSCEPHYEVTGVSTRTCRGGAWSGAEPQCRLVYSKNMDNSFKAGDKGYKIGMK